MVVSGQDVTRGKPDPEIYLAAAHHLGVHPERCLVFEDAPNGIASAKAAGMTVIALRTPYTEGLDLGAVDAVVDSLEDVDLDSLMHEGPYR